VGFFVCVGVGVGVGLRVSVCEIEGVRVGGALLCAYVFEGGGVLFCSFVRRGRVFMRSCGGRWR
jgi:hypothetical protein